MSPFPNNLAGGHFVGRNSFLPGPRTFGVSWRSKWLEISAPSDEEAVRYHFFAEDGWCFCSAAWCSVSTQTRLCKGTAAACVEVSTGKESQGFFKPRLSFSRKLRRVFMALPVLMSRGHRSSKGVSPSGRTTEAGGAPVPRRCL